MTFLQYLIPQHLLSKLMFRFARIEVVWIKNSFTRWFIKNYQVNLDEAETTNVEDYLSFKDRILGAWDAIAAKPDGSHVLLVTHGGVMRVVLPTVLGMPLNRSFPLHIPFACLSRISLVVDDDKVSASLLSHNATIK